MARIFLNYRRKDEPGYVQALYEKLQVAFPGSVYMDVDGAIEPGDDFVDMLRQRVAESDVVLAAIGPKWLSELIARNEPARDYVVIEIRLAFELGKLVIPVLLHEARMPPPEALPEAIRELSQRHAFSLRSERFGADCAGLVNTLQRRLQKDADSSYAGIAKWALRRLPAPPPRVGCRQILLGAWVLSVLMGVGVVFWTVVVVYLVAESSEQRVADSEGDASIHDERSAEVPDAGQRSR